MSALAWLRRDLRTHDHPVLARAAEIGNASAAFVFDQVILSALQDRNDRRVTFIHDSVAEVQTALRSMGGDLLTRFGDPLDVIPSLARALKVDVVVAARDYEPYALQRDAEVARRLEADGRRLELVRDHVVIEPDEIRSQTGGPYSVFTPYSKAWRAAFHVGRIAEVSFDSSQLRSAQEFEAFRETWTLEQMGFVRADLWEPGGMARGAARLQEFAHRIDRYAEERDVPALHSTSVLSPHLRFGTVSARETVRLALESNSKGAEKWLSELIWRDFYQHVLFQWPHVAERAFKPEFDALEWPGSLTHFEAWKAGMTGFPIVDAAMRCFNATGWMHNRLRMIVASFLTKDLLIDYKLGEAHFARFLIDFELASNNGGWQWSASTGCDAQPYFRIFNPWLQSAKFDPEGVFIRQWCPELAKFSKETLHKLHEATMFEQLEAGCTIGEDYPAPIVEHHVQKDLAIKLLESAKKAP